MKLLKNKWFILTVITAAVIVLAAFAMRGKDKPQYFTAKADKGDIREVVEATGTINAVITVQVGSQVSGMIYKLHADFNSRVHKGELIAEIEPSLFQGAVMQAKADLENAKASFATAKANLEKSKATAAQTHADYVRTQGLTTQGITSQQQLDLAKATAEAGAAQVSADQANVNQAGAQVQQREAALKVAQINLDHTYIYAPIDGTVVNRAVDVGQTVAASLQAPTLFTIAQDLTKMQVYTKTDESDVGSIRPGQKVSFKVDAFPRDTFGGVVSQVRMNPTTVQNVVTYDTIIDFDNPELKLFPGMTAYVSIPVASAHDVIRISNGALRYTPELRPEELQAKLKDAGIEMGRAKRQGAPADSGTNTASAQGAGSPQGGARSGAPGARQFGQGGAQPGGGTTRDFRAPDIGIVWKLAPDKSLVPVQVRTGITDHTVTEVTQVLHGDLKDGDELVIGAQVAKGGASRPMGGPGGGARPPGR